MVLIEQFPETFQTGSQHESVLVSPASGHILPFYGLRLLMDWTALYAVATVISIVWLIYAGRNLRKHQKSLKK